MSFVRIPLGLKAERKKRGTAKAKAHMAKIAQLSCVCCGAHPVEVHHCISGRFSQAKASDFETIPLCYDHHRGAEGIHTNKRQWEAAYGADTDYLPVVRDMLAGQYNNPWVPNDRTRPYPEQRTAIHFIRPSGASRHAPPH